MTSVLAQTRSVSSSKLEALAEELAQGPTATFMRTKRVVRLAATSQLETALERIDGPSVLARLYDVRASLQYCRHLLMNSSHL
jgi:hypothetical protein